jgi:hypothetical protein
MPLEPSLRCQRTPVVALGLGGLGAAESASAASLPESSSTDLKSAHTVLGRTGTLLALLVSQSDFSSRQRSGMGAGVLE